MIRIRLFFIAFLLSFSLFNEINAQTASEVARSVFPSTVLLVTTNAKGKIVSLGSGFFVDANTIATNYHVIRGSAKILIKITGRKELFPVSRVISTDAKRDLALLLIERAQAPPLPLGDSDHVEIGNAVYVVGNPQGLEGTFSQGIISGIRILNGKRYLQLTAPISPGSSGGAVLNAEGEVIGIAVATLRDGQNLNFAIPVADLKTFFARASSTASRPPFSSKDVNAEAHSSASPKSYKPYTSPYIEKEIEKALSEVRINPKSPEAQFNLAETYRRWRRKLEAIRAYLETIRLKSEFADAYYGLAETYMSDVREPEVNKAIVAYKQAIRIKPDYFEAHLGLGKAYKYLELYNEAIDALKIAISINSNDADAFRELGWIYFYFDNDQEALKAYSEAVRLDPRDYQSLCDIGDIYFDLELYGPAIDYYEKSISHPQRYGAQEGYDDLCVAYRESMSLSRGVKFFKDLIINIQERLSKKDVPQSFIVYNGHNLAYVHYGLGTLYVYLGEKRLALEEYKAIKALGTGGPYNSIAEDLFNLIYRK